MVLKMHKNEFWKQDGCVFDIVMRESFATHLASEFHINPL